METLDCLIIGAGPAGLLAATYLTRFRRRVLVVHDGASRAALIPRSHNYPGYADGIGGVALLENLRAQAERYGARFVEAHVNDLRREGGHFIAHAGEAVHATTVLLATGVIDIEPALPDLPNAIRRGYVRHCPICDAFEVRDQAIVIIGRGHHAINEALFLRHYTDRIDLILLDRDPLDAEQRARLKRADIAVIEETLERIVLQENRISALRFAGGRERRYDAVYSALGAINRSELAIALNARHSDDGAVIVDAHQQTSVAGLYAAGDVVQSLNQIAVAFAHAAIASTAIHNRLRNA